MNKSQKGKANSQKDDAKEISAILFDQSHVAIFILDPQQRLMDLNWAGSSLLGYARDEFLKLTFSDLLHPETRGRIDLNGLETGGTLKNQCQMRHKDGDYLSLTMDVRRLSSQNFLATVYDDSAIGLYQNRADQRTLEKIVDQSPAIAFLWRAEAGWPVKYVSDSIRQFGYSPQDLYSGRVQFASIIHPDDLERVSDEVRNYSQIGRTEFTQEYRILTAVGKTRWVDDRTWVLRDVDGHVVHYQGIILDITEHKEAVQALKESEEKFRSIVENSLAGIFMVNEAYQFVYANDELCRILGYPRDELTGLDFRKVLSENSRALVTDRYIRRQRGEDVPNRYELEVLRCDGEVRDAEMIVTVVKDTAGRNNTMGQLVDISERKRVEQALHQSEERLQQAVRVSGIATFDHDQLTDIMRISPNFREIFGFDQDETVSFPSLMTRIHPDDLKQVESKLQRAHAPTGNGFYSNEHRIIDRKENVHWLSIRSQTFYSGEGDSRRPVRTVGAVLDVTESKKVQEALRQSEERLQQAIRVSQIGIFDHDHVSDTTYWSPEQRKNYGFDPDEPVTLEGFLNHVYPDDLPEIGDAVKRAHDPSGDGLFDVEYRIVRRDGAVRWLTTRSQTLFEGEGDARQPVRTVGGSVDTTERKQVEEALKETRFFLQKSQSVAQIGSYYFNIRAGSWISSPALDELLGIDGEYPKTTDGWIDLVHPDFKDEMLHYLEEHVLKNHNRFEKEYRIVRHSDGQERWVFGLGELEFDDQGNTVKMIGTIQDITDRRRMSDALQESRNLLRTVLDAAPIRFFWKDLNLRYLGCNQPFASDAGLSSPEEIIGKDDYQMGWQDQADLYRNDDRRVIESGKPKLNYEEPQTTPDGRTIWLRTSKVPLKDGEGNIRGVLGTYEDVTERKQAEEALRRTRFTVEHVSDAIQWIDQNGQIVDVNEAACHMLGYTREELTQMKVLDIDATPPFDVQPGFADQLRKTGTATFETRHRAKDGRLVPVEIVANMITFGDEEFNCCFVRDITERKRSESLLRLRLRLFEYATDHSLGELLQKTLDELGDLTESPIGFYHFVDADERTLSLQAWSSRTLKEFCKAEGSGMHYSIDEAGVWVDCVRKRQPVVHNDYASLPHRKGLPEGHAHLVRELVVPVFRNGRIVAILGVGNKQQDYIDQDVEFVSYVADLAWELAERKRTDEEREILITELEAKNSELERFTYTVSHDLKAPLVTIKGFLGFLKQDIASGNVERVNNNIERIGNAAVKMEQLLKDLLELSRIGRMVNPSEEIPFDDLIREALEIVHGQLDDRGITFHAQSNLPVIYGDRLRLVEVLQNLLDNAAKYMGDQTDPHIEIGQRGEENAMPEFFVKDNGIGIDPEYHERIFGLFNKLDVGSEGTGVGLALVKRIVEFHGGRIWVESEAGKGATFLFTLRTKPTA